MRSAPAVVVMLVCATGVSALNGQSSQTNLFDAVNLAIPDGDAAGRQDVQNLTSEIVELTSIRVRLKIVGEYNGDLYGYLRHTDGSQTHIAVLLNRPGRSATNNWGYPDSGLDITLADSAPTDIHAYRENNIPPPDSPLTGEWQADARFVDPFVVLQTSPRTAFLSGFSGMAASGEWTLFLADMDAGATNYLVSWGLELTGKTRPALTWTNPTAIVYGTALGAEQLNAAANVPGTFTYAPPAGTVLNATNNQLLSVTFQPEDSNTFVTIATNVTLVVLPASLTVTATNASKTYGATNPSLQGELTGLIPGDGLSVTFAATADTNSAVGDYPILATFTDSSNKLGNYSITTNLGTLTVLPAPLLVQANDASRGYGQSNPVFTATFTGWVNGEDTNVLSGNLGFTILADTNSLIGSYAIEPGGLTATNYALTFSNGTLTVTAGVLLLTGDPISRAYGNTNPPLTGSLIGLLPGDDITVSFSTEAETNSPAGVYPIHAALNDPGNKLDNYSITTNLGALTVLPAPLLVQVNDVNRPYGQTNPVFTVTFTGWVNGEDTNALTSELNFITTAETNSPIGSYPIEPGGLTATNYALTFSNGTLTVTATALLLSVDSVSRPYGSTNPPLTGMLTGLVPGDDIIAICTASADTNSPVGAYPLAANFIDPGSKLGNYAITTNLGSLLVQPTPLLVQANDLSRGYGQTNPVFTAAFTGWVNGQDTNVLSGTLNFSTAAETNSPVGSYAVEPSGLSATNYALTFSNGTLIVTLGVLVLNADSVSRPYGTTNPPLAGAVTGLLPSDDITASFSTTADFNSPVGIYLITASLIDPGGKLSNYSITTNLGALTITPAASGAILSSSANPAQLGIPVTFQVTLNALAPSQGLPTGAVQFQWNGSDLGGSVPVVAGQAEFNTAALTAGIHSISVVYVGDGNFLGVTTTLTPDQRINSAPAPGVDVIARVPNEVTRTPISGLLANDSDPDGDAVTFASVAPTSLGGGAVVETNGWLYYTPPENFLAEDSFTYFVQDGWGGLTASTVLITTLTNQQIAAQMALTQPDPQTFQLTLLGMPWANYTIEATESLTVPHWSGFAVGTADQWGQLVVTDTLTPSLPARFYRGVYQGTGEISLPYRLDLSSSATAALPGAPVTFAVQLTALATNSPTPTGTIQFQIDGTNYGAATDFTGAVASLSTATLPLGWHTVTAHFTGDPNYRHSSCALPVPQLINTPPQALPDVVLRGISQGTKHRVSDLLGNDSDGDGDLVEFLGVSQQTQEGGNLATSDGWVFYTPPAGFVNADAFTYTVRDRWGATTTATVEIVPRVGYEPAANLALLDLGAGTYRIAFSGIPWRTYNIEYTETTSAPHWQLLTARTTDSQGRFYYDDTVPAEAPSRYYRSVSLSGGTTASPFRQAAWTNFIAHTNGRVMEMWSERAHPEGWPLVPPRLAWNTNSILYGCTGFTAISQCNEFEGASGQVPVTLLTRRHAYARGHSMGTNGLRTLFAGKRVWFCAADDTVVPMTVAAEHVRVGFESGISYDYTILIFTEDAPPNLSPVAVISPAARETYYANTPDLPFFYLAPEQTGRCAAGVPPFLYPIFKGGDSGSPNFLLAPDNKLVLFAGRGTSSIDPQMQTDMDALSLFVGINPAPYQLQWYDLSPWAP